MAKRIKLGQKYDPVEMELEFPNGEVKTYTVRDDFTEETLQEMDGDASTSAQAKLASLFNCDPDEFKGLDLRDMAMVVRDTMQEVMKQVHGVAVNPTQGVETKSPTS